MATPWVVTKGMQTVRAEFNSLSPDRDKGSDGSVGDLAHQLESASGHNPDISGAAEYRDGDSLNEVRAIDVDKDLKVITMEAVIQYLVTRGRAGYYLPFRYFIYRGRIWRKSTGWATETYNGPSPHTEHAHFSGDYTQTADNWSGSLGFALLVPGGVGMDLLVKKNDTGQNVAFWQYFLADLGFYKGKVDDVYGPTMEAAVNAYRKSVGITSTVTEITGWQGFSMIAAVAEKRARKVLEDAKDSLKGEPGKDGLPGKDGVLTGTLTITGGMLTATTE